MKTIHLNGAWELTSVDSGQLPDNLDELDWIQGEVPNTVQQILLDQGMIPDLRIGLNAEKIRWIEEKDWYYRKSFELEDGEYPKTELIFEGLDTICTIWVNGFKLAEHHNMYVPLQLDVTRYIHNGQNQIVIRFYSATRWLREHERDDRLWVGGLSEEPNLPWLRKAPVGFTEGWWGPRVTTVGIWRPVYMNRTEKAKLSDIHVKPVLNDRLDQVDFQLQVSIDHVQQLEAEFEVEFRIEDNHAVVGGKSAFYRLKGNETLSVLLNVAVSKPKLWWPNCYGEPHLYQISVILKERNGQWIEQHQMKRGVYSFKLREEAQELGSSFIFEVNNEPVFIKGTNWVPPDVVNINASSERKVYLLEAAASAHMNMIRVWGGGVYEDAVFYETCDRLGILVWQDFPYACNPYPDWDDDFVSEAVREATIALRRLRNYTSLALWCGNNENQWTHHRSYPIGETPSRMSGVSLFEEIFPQLVEQEDPGKIYRPSTPFGGEDPNNTFEGTQHYYPDLNLPLEQYGQISFRFLAEFNAIASVPEKETLESFLLPKDMFPHSPVWRYHTPRLPDPGYRVDFQDNTDFYMKELFGVNHFDNISQETYFAYNRLVHGELHKIIINNMRRQKFDCSGTMFWYFTDQWPSIHWSAIDYWNRPKSSYYYIKRLYAPIHLCFEGTGVDLAICLINDRLQAQEVELVWHCGSQTGAIHYEETKRMQIPKNGVCHIRELTLASLRMNANNTDDYVYASIYQEGVRLAEDVYFMAGTQKCAKTPTKIDAHIAEDGTIALSSPTFAHYVHLWMDGVIFEDNDFHLLPGRERTIRIEKAIPSLTRSNKLTISSINSAQVIELEL